MTGGDMAEKHENEDRGGHDHEDNDKLKPPKPHPVTPPRPFGGWA